MVPSRLTATSASWVQVILLPQPPKQLGLQVACHHAQLIFVFLVEMGFHYVGQAGLELLTLGNTPALASQSAGSTCMMTAPGPISSSYTDTSHIVLESTLMTSF